MSRAHRGLAPLCPLSEDEADGFPELDKEDENDEQRCTLGNAERGDLEDVRDRADMACHHGERHREQDDTESYDWYQAATEGGGEELARGGEQDGMGRHRQQSDDYQIENQKHCGYSKGRLLTIGEERGLAEQGYCPTLLQTA